MPCKSIVKDIASLNDKLIKKSWREWDGNNLVVIAIMHNKQSPVTINQTIARLLTHYGK